MNKKLFAVIRREYLTRVRTKGFIIGTLLTPAMIILIFSGIFIFAKVFAPSTKKYVIVDQSGRIYEEFTSMFTDTLRNGQPKFIFTERKISSRNQDAEFEELQRMVRAKEIDGYFIIPEDIIDTRIVRYSARSVSNFDEQRDFTRALSRIVTNNRLENKGLSPEEIRKEMAMGSVSLVSRQVTEQGEIEKSGVSSFILTYFLTYILFLLIMIYGQTLMRSVIEEKTQRITETIISSIKPIELMVGKLVGICLLGLTQLVILGLFVLAAAAYGEPVFVKFGVNAPEVLDIIRQINFSPAVFSFMLIFFLLGFVLYAVFYAAIGAIVNTEDEGQQFQFPVIILVLLGYFMMFSVAQNPETSRALWMSLIPFFTPIVMFARIAVSDPIIPSGAYLSIFTMLVSVVLTIWVVSKIYRVGILMYGKKPSLKEALKWVRYK